MSEPRDGQRVTVTLTGTYERLIPGLGTVVTDHDWSVVIDREDPDITIARHRGPGTHPMTTCRPTLTHPDIYHVRAECPCGWATDPVPNDDQQQPGAAMIRHQLGDTDE